MMNNKGELDAFFQEASWCYKCAKRDSCQEKDVVAWEERMTDALKHLKVTAKCSGYIYDSSVKINPRESFLEKFLRGGL